MPMASNGRKFIKNKANTSKYKQIQRKTSHFYGNFVEMAICICQMPIVIVNVANGRRFRNSCSPGPAFGHVGHSRHVMTFYDKLDKTDIPGKTSLPNRDLIVIRP